MTAAPAYKKWLNKAYEDELSAGSILKHADGAPSTVCFLSQQMGEKLLKALLQGVRIRFQKEHDLSKLGALLITKYPEVAEYENDFKLLNRFYIDARYPGDIEEFSFSDAEAAFAAALRIKDFVMQKIEIGVTPDK